MGVLTPVSAHARPSAQPPIDTSGAHVNNFFTRIFVSVVLNSGGKKKKERRRLIPKIVATFVYASSHGERTHSARTNCYEINSGNNSISKLLWLKLSDMIKIFQWKSVSLSCLTCPSSKLKVWYGKVSVVHVTVFDIDHFIEFDYFLDQTCSHVNILTYFPTLTNHCVTRTQ